MAAQRPRHGALAYFFCLCCCALLLLPLLLNVQRMAHSLTDYPTRVLPPLAISLPLPPPPLRAYPVRACPAGDRQRFRHSAALASCLPSMQLLNIETTKSQAQLFAALKEGNKAMKEMQQVGRFARRPVAVCVRSMQHCIDAHAKHGLPSGQHRGCVVPCRRAAQQFSHSLLLQPGHVTIFPSVATHAAVFPFCLLRSGHAA